MKAELIALAAHLRDELTDEQKEAIRPAWLALQRAAQQDAAFVADLMTRERSARQQLRIVIRQLDEAERELEERG